MVVKQRTIRSVPKAKKDGQKRWAKKDGIYIHLTSNSPDSANPIHHKTPMAQASKIASRGRELLI
jgi:3-hydroxyisobutyrate dehydrogenase-like beta-hydroxyacid dehydrogenase